MPYNWIKQLLKHVLNRSMTNTELLQLIYNKCPFYYIRLYVHICLTWYTARVSPVPRVCQILSRVCQILSRVCQILFRIIKFYRFTKLPLSTDFEDLSALYRLTQTFFLVCFYLLDPWLLYVYQQTTCNKYNFSVQN